MRPTPSSCRTEYDGPGAASAKFGRISASVASVPRTARAEDAPCSWKVCSKCLPAPKDEAEPDNAVEHDHHRREHRVTRDPVAALGAGEHDRYDESDFDHRHRDGEQDRAERLAELERQHLCVMDGREDRRAEEETGEDQDVARRRRERHARISAPAGRSPEPERPKSRSEWRHGAKPASAHSVARTPHSAHQGAAGNWGASACAATRSLSARPARIRYALTFSFTRVFSVYGSSSSLPRLSRPASRPAPARTQAGEAMVAR